MVVKRKVKILHILPHAGGGVGAVLRAMLKAESETEGRYDHRIASLEYLNDVTQRHCDHHRISWIDKTAENRGKELSAFLSSTDIVLVHWWNHPFLMRLLFAGLPSSRLIIWSHVNGFHAPQTFFPELFELPDRFVFSSSVSLTAPTVLALEKNFLSKLRVIRSCAGIPAGSEHLGAKPPPFQAGYIGTVEPVKMHADFLTLCAEAAIPTPIIVAGGPAAKALWEKAEALKLADGFEILGPVSDPAPLFRRLHALAYPLNPRHYGTGEQVLIEAMAFGAVPVVLANPPEKALIRDGQTGLIVKEPAGFPAALRLLADNPAKRDKLALAGHRFVKQACGIEHTIRAFHTLFDEVLSLPKSPRKLQLQTIKGVPFGSPLHLFLASLGNTQERRCCENMLHGDQHIELPIDFAAKTRGTPFHYRELLRGDPEIESLCHTLAQVIS